MVDQARNSAYGAMKVFTLVDTYTLTVTMFLAVLLCGHEGGMQRAVMYPYLHLPVLSHVSQANFVPDTRAD
jgi:hypothetical protein